MKTLQSQTSEFCSSIKMVALTTLQYYVILLTHNLLGMFGAKTWIAGQLQCNIGYLFVWTLQIGLLYVIAAQNFFEVFLSGGFYQVPVGIITYRVSLETA